MTDEQLNNTLCLVVVSYKPDPHINTTRSFSLYRSVKDATSIVADTICLEPNWSCCLRSVKDATSIVADTKKPHEEVILYTTDEERLLIAVFPREDTKT